MQNINNLVRMPERQPENIGFVYFDWTVDEGTPFVRRALIAEGPWSLLAYVGIPESHWMAGCEAEDFPLKVHGGLTYAGSEGDGPRPQGWYLYGWDYGHFGDKTKRDRRYAALYDYDTGEHDWTLEEVWADTKEALIQLGNLMRKGL